VHFGILACLFVGLMSALTGPRAWATVPRDGQGFAIADDGYFGFPDAQHAFLTRAEDWYGQSFAALRPAAFRFQISWNADQALIERAKMLVDYMRRQGVRQVVVSFKKNGPAPDAATYGASIRQVIAQLAGYVDVWGPANEPNVGDTWLPGAGGAQTLAQYWAQFSGALGELDPTALTLSPEFADRRDLGSIGSYVSAYVNAGGGFGDIVGWHPYWGTNAMTRSTTDDLLRYVPADLPVWVTEVGAWGTNAHVTHPIEDGELAQNRRLAWLANDPSGLAAHPRITQIHHYHMRDSGQPDWDSALVRRDGLRRAAWYTWCHASHGDDPRGCDRSTRGVAAGLLSGLRLWERSLWERSASS
jgi:hypothetical protein